MGIPMSCFAGDGEEYRRVLLNRGFVIGIHEQSRDLLSEYIQSCSPTFFDRWDVHSKVGETEFMPNRGIGQ